MTSNLAIVQDLTTGRKEGYMKTGKTLTELAVELTRIQQAKKDFIVPTTKLSMTEKGDLQFTNGAAHDYKLTSFSAGQVASFADVPKQYFDRILAENPKLAADSVNHGFARNAKTEVQQKDTARLVRTIDGKVRGFLSDKYRILDSHDLLETALPELMQNDFEVMSSEITDKRLYLKCASPKIEGEVKKGDVIRYGVMLSTSDVGAGSLRVEPYFLRLACLNGMVSETKFSKAHLGRSNYENDIRELMSDNTKRLNDAAFFATVRDYLKSTMNPQNFERELNKMREASERKIENMDLVEVVELTAKQFGVTGENTKKGILQALAQGNEGAGLTQWGLANSFTRFAQDDSLDYDQSTELERVGSAIIELNPSQWQKIAV